jgi:hypothetical protein
VDEDETIDEREVLEGLRERRDRKEEDELDRGAAAGMMTADLRIADLENLGALLARSGSVETSGLGVVGIGTESAHSPLNLWELCIEEVDALAEVDMDLCESRLELDQSPLSVDDFRGVGRSRSTIDRRAKSSLGEGGGLSRPPAPVTQLAAVLPLSLIGSSSTCRQSGLDMRT